MIEYQLRIYSIRPGTMEEFVKGWRTHIVPVREQIGFKILHAFVNEQKNEFIWLISWEGPEGIAAANDAYASSPARKVITWNPQQYIENMDLRILKNVPFQMD